MAQSAAIVCPSCRAQLSPDARFCGACGSTIIPGAGAPAGLDSLIGRVLAGRYRVLSQLGAGGMGTVFRAEQVSVKRQIALKVLDPAMTVNPELMRRFQAEAEVVARLSHPNTVTLFDFGQAEGGLLFIAMELVDGRGLRQTIHGEAPLTPHRAVDIAEQIASSLADAHAHGIVHRDLKPDNVILSERAGRKDFARVLDFGIAKLYDGSGGTAMTKAGQILGTPQYMAPEQVTGGTIDGRTDIYALGVILYEMLTKRPPFQNENLIALLSMHMNDPPPPMGLSLPMPLERLVMGSLAKQPAARPPDMKTVAAELADLRALLDPGPRRPSAMAPAVAPVFTPAPPYLTPPPQRAAPPPRAARRSRWPWALLALLIVGGGTAGAVVAMRGKKAPESVATPAQAASGEGETFHSPAHGYALALPPGLSMREDTSTGTALAQGVYEGNVISIAVAPVSGPDDAESRSQQIVGSTGGSATIRERRTRTIRGGDLVSIVYDVDKAGSRFETVFFPAAQPLAVTFAAPQSYFDETAALRDSLFRDRFQPAGGAP